MHLFLPFPARFPAASLALVFFCVAPVLAAQSSPSLFHEDVVAEITPGAEAKQILVGDHHLAWVEKLGDKRTVFLDGKQQGATYDEVKFLDVNPEESHLVFFGKKASEWIFVLDGQERPGGYASATAVAFQPNGSSIAFGECREKKCRLVVDGALTGSEYEDISFPRYSQDGKKIAFVAKRGKKWIAVVDGKELGPDLDQVWFSSWGFSRASGKFFVSGRIKNHWIHLIDGSSNPGYEVISRLTFSPDGKHYAYAGADNKGGFKKQKIFGTAVMDGQPVATYEGKGMTGSWSALGGSEEIMVGGVRDLVTDFHGVSSPEFNPDGILVYAARRDKGDVAVFQGKEAGPGFDEILSPIIFTMDSSHFAYVARQGQDFVEVRDNKPILTIPAGKRGATSVGWMAMSTDAVHLAYETISGGAQFKAANTKRAYRTVVIDGKSGPEYNALALSAFNFDIESHHYFYEVIGAEGDRDLVNVDGHESRIYDAVAKAHYLPDGKRIAFLARDGARFLRVTFLLDPAGALPNIQTASIIGDLRSAGSP
jgi:hypothetical protein